MKSNDARAGYDYNRGVANAWWSAPRGWVHVVMFEHVVGLATVGSGLTLHQEGPALGSSRGGRKNRRGLCPRASRLVIVRPIGQRSRGTDLPSTTKSCMST